MDAQTIVSTFLIASLVAVVAFVAHRWLAGTGERAGCASMIAFVIGWLAVVTVLVTGLFLAGVGS